LFPIKINNVPSKKVCISSLLLPLLYIGEQSLPDISLVNQFMNSGVAYDGISDSARNFEQCYGLWPKLPKFSNETGIRAGGTMDSGDFTSVLEMLDGNLSGSKKSDVKIKFWFALAWPMFWIGLIYPGMLGQELDDKKRAEKKSSDSTVPVGRQGLQGELENGEQKNSDEH